MLLGRCMWEVCQGVACMAGRHFATSAAEPRHSAPRWSCDSRLCSSTDPLPSWLLPPAASVSSARGKVSYRQRSLGAAVPLVGEQ